MVQRYVPYERTVTRVGPLQTGCGHEWMGLESGGVSFISALILQPYIVKHLQEVNEQITKVRCQTRAGQESGSFSPVAG